MGFFCRAAMKLKRGNKFKTASKFKRKGIQVTGQWKPIEIDPSLFADEQLGGLVCFEELTDYKLVASSKVGEETKKRKLISKEEETESIVPKKKRKKEKNLGEETRESSELNIEDQAAEQEDAIVSHVESDAAVVTSPPKKQKKRKPKKKASSTPDVSTASSKKAKNWTAEVLSASSDLQVDMSAWKGLFVPEPVLQALGELGFSAPTPIQALALPSAIRDSMDVLGAAETGTVSYCYAVSCKLCACIPHIHEHVTL